MSKDKGIPNGLLGPRGFGFYERMVSPRYNARDGQTLTYYVDNSQLNHSNNHGLSYRRSKHLDDKVDGQNAEWSSLIRGVDQGDGWVMVGHRSSARYLPKMVQGHRVLKCVAEVELPTEEDSDSGESEPEYESTAKVVQQKVRYSKEGTHRPAQVPQLSIPQLENNDASENTDNVAVVATQAVDKRKAVAASAIGAGTCAVAGGAGTGAVGVVAGGIAGGLAGIPAALFTFGLSIPIGAIAGAAAGGSVGVATGSSVGAAVGGTVGYKGYVHRADVSEAISKANQSTKSRWRSALQRLKGGNAECPAKI